MYAIDFEYAGEHLSDYGMMICNFDSSGNEVTSSGADITFNQIKTNGSNKFNIFDSNYESAYTTTFNICKTPCSAINNLNMYLSVDEVSAIQRWLCRHEYNKFKVDQDKYDNVYWNSTFSCKQVEFGGKIIGLELTMTTDAPYGYLDEVFLEYECNASKSFALYDVSDEVGYIYPNMEITLLSDGVGDNKEFRLSNTMDTKTLIIKGCNKGEVIKINGDILLLESSLEDSIHTTISSDFNYFFPKIINTYESNKNEYETNVDCNISFRYSPIRKVGI